MDPATLAAVVQYVALPLIGALLHRHGWLTFLFPNDKATPTLPAPGKDTHPLLPVLDHNQLLAMVWKQVQGNIGTVLQDALKKALEGKFPEAAGPVQQNQGK